MKRQFNKQWIDENKRAILAEFDDFNLDNPCVNWRRLNRCQAWHTGDALISYRTLVAIRKWCQFEDGTARNVVFAKDTFSPTTVKHIYTFAREVEAKYIVFLNSSKGPYAVRLKRMVGEYYV